MNAQRRGRPPLGERVPLGLRVTPDMKARLDAAAEASGRSQSQEAEFRLARSFEREDLLTEVLALAFGRELAGILLSVGTAMGEAGRAVKREPGWTAHDASLSEAVEAGIAVLNTIFPVPEQGTIRTVGPDGLAYEFKFDATDQATERRDDKRDKDRPKPSDAIATLLAEESAKTGLCLRELLGPKLSARLERAWTRPRGERCLVDLTHDTLLAAAHNALRAATKSSRPPSPERVALLFQKAIFQSGVSKHARQHHKTG